MKLYQLIIVILLMTVIAVMTGCEYDGPTAKYDQPYDESTMPEISQVSPAEAVPGFNYITLLGENFSDDFEKVKVYFDGIPGDIYSHSDTELIIRRPNQTGDSITIKVINYDAYLIAEYGPYKIYPVTGRYGSFNDNAQLRAMVMDDDGNLYVVQYPGTMFKVTPEEVKTTVAEISGQIYGAAISPNGQFAIFSHDKEISKIDLETGEQSKFAEVGARVRFGVFDADGYLYTGGRRSDVFVVAPGDTTGDAIGVYAQDEISCMRVFDNHLYLLVELGNPDASNPEVALWRHSLNGNGSLSARELVLDFSQTGVFAESSPNTFAIANNGMICVGTNYDHPILIYNPDNESQDILYKDIVPSSASKLVFGNGHYLYGAIISDVWDVLRIDLGALGESN